MILRVIKLCTCDAFHCFNLLLQLQRMLIGNIGNHDLCRSIGNELLIHYCKTAPCLGAVRKIFRNVIFNINPIC